MQVNQYDWIVARLEPRRAMRRLVTGQSARLNSNFYLYCTPHRFNLTQAKLTVDGIITATEKDLALVRQFRQELNRLGGSK